MDKIWGFDKSEATARVGKAQQALGLTPVKYIHFEYKGVKVTPAMYKQVSTELGNGLGAFDDPAVKSPADLKGKYNIVVGASASLKEGAAWNQKANIMVFPQQPLKASRGLFPNIVHESTHAALDINGQKVTQIVNEVVAYIAGATFMVIDTATTGGSGNDLEQLVVEAYKGVNDEITPAAVRVAMNMYRERLRSKNLGLLSLASDDASIATLATKIKADSTYAGMKPDDVVDWGN